jgi:hypothetical protein
LGWEIPPPWTSLMTWGRRFDKLPGQGALDCKPLALPCPLLLRAPISLLFVAVRV